MKTYNLQPSLLFDVANMLKKLNVKDVPTNNYEILNIQACSFNIHVSENEVHLISSGKMEVLRNSPNIH